MHILFLTDNFVPEVNAPATRTFEHCREWVEHGHEVTVVTCVPNFPRGKVFDGYQNKPWQSEMIMGIRVIRVWSYIAPNQGFLKRILDYQSFMFTAMLASLFVRRVDLVVGTSPQFFTVCAACFVAFMKRAPWVFELRDLWPASIKAVGAMSNSTALRLLEKLEMFLYRNATRIVTVTHSLQDDLVCRGIDAAKISVVTNGVDLASFGRRERDSRLARALGLQGKFVAGYVGTHGLAHGLETLLEAARIAATLPEAKSVHFLFLGDGARKMQLMSAARALGLTNVLFLDSVPKKEIPRYLSLLDISIIHLRKIDIFTGAIPSKLFECMSMGIPVLHGLKGESAEIVANERIGKLFEPEDPHDLVASLLHIRRHQKEYARYVENGPSAARHYDRKKLALDMLNMMEKLQPHLKGGRMRVLKKTPGNP